MTSQVYFLNRTDEIGERLTCLTYLVGNQEQPPF